MSSPRPANFLQVLVRAAWHDAGNGRLSARAAAGGLGHARDDFRHCRRERRRLLFCAAAVWRAGAVVGQPSRAIGLPRPQRHLRALRHHIHVRAGRWRRGRRATGCGHWCVCASRCVRMRRCCCAHRQQTNRASHHNRAPFLSLSPSLSLPRSPQPSRRLTSSSKSSSSTFCTLSS